jgi:hypothetical protein
MHSAFSLGRQSAEQLSYTGSQYEKGLQQCTHLHNSYTRAHSLMLCRASVKSGLKDGIKVTYNII